MRAYGQRDEWLERDGLGGFASGCPFQAWSVSEALRLDRVVLAATGLGAQGSGLGGRDDIVDSQ